MKLSTEGIKQAKDRIDIIRTGDWGESYKAFEITKEVLFDFVRNFDKNVMGLNDGELQLNYSHKDYEEAAGWITKLEVENRNGVYFLVGDVRWTENGKNKIESQEFKYISAELTFEETNDETGVVTQNVLLGAALTNIPFVRSAPNGETMGAVALSDNGRDNVFLYSNNFFMEKFGKMLSDASAKKKLSKDELLKLQGAFLILSEEEQEKVKDQVDALEEEKEVVESKEVEPKKENEALSLSNEKTVLLESRIKQLELDKKKSEIALKLSMLVGKGKMTPAQRKVLEPTLSTLSIDNVEVVLNSYAEGVVQLNLSEVGSSEEDHGNGFDAANKEAQQRFSASTDENKNLALFRAQVYKEFNLK